MLHVRNGSLLCERRLPLPGADWLCGLYPAPHGTSLCDAVLCCPQHHVQEGDMRHTVYYPTPAALAARIKLAEQLGVGLSIWELGQGLDSFMDLL